MKRQKLNYSINHDRNIISEIK